MEKPRGAGGEAAVSVVWAVSWSRRRGKLALDLVLTTWGTQVWREESSRRTGGRKV